MCTQYSEHVVQLTRNGLYPTAMGVIDDPGVGSHHRVDLWWWRGDHGVLLLLLIHQQRNLVGYHLCQVLRNLRERSKVAAEGHGGPEWEGEGLQLGTRQRNLLLLGNNKQRRRALFNNKPDAVH